MSSIAALPRYLSPQPPPKPRRQPPFLPTPCFLLRHLQGPRQGRRCARSSLRRFLLLEPTMFPKIHGGTMAAGAGQTEDAVVSFVAEVRGRRGRGREGTVPLAPTVHPPSCQKPPASRVYARTMASVLWGSEACLMTERLTPPFFGRCHKNAKTPKNVCCDLPSKPRPFSLQNRWRRCWYCGIGRPVSRPLFAMASHCAAVHDRHSRPAPKIRATNPPAALPCHSQPKGGRASEHRVRVIAFLFFSPLPLRLLLLVSSCAESSRLPPEPLPYTSSSSSSSE